MKKFRLLAIGGVVGWVSGFCFAFTALNIFLVDPPVCTPPAPSPQKNLSLHSLPFFDGRCDAERQGPPRVVFDTNHHYRVSQKGTDVKIHEIHYPPFALRLPRFINSSHEQWWRNDSANSNDNFDVPRECCEQSPSLCQTFTQLAHEGARVFCRSRSPSYVRGDIVITNSPFSVYGECGQQGVIETRSGGVNGGKPLLYVPVPDSYSLQHFTDGTLPKYAQLDLLTGLKTPAYALQEINRRRSPLVAEVLDSWGLDVVNRVPPSRGDTYYLCHAPPLHPVLWMHGQRLLGVLYRPLRERKKVVYLSRKQGTTNGGRNVVNEEEFLKELQVVTPVTVFRSQEYNLDGVRQLFRDTFLLLGPHGGAFSHLMFLSCNAKVMEFIPMGTRGLPIFIYSVESLMLDLDYYAVPTPTVDAKYNMKVDIPSVISAIKQMLTQ